MPENMGQHLLSSFSLVEVLTGVFLPHVLPLPWPSAKFDSMLTSGAQKLIVGD